MADDQIAVWGDSPGVGTGVRAAVAAETGAEHIQVVVQEEETAANPTKTLDCKLWTRYERQAAGTFRKLAGPSRNEVDTEILREFVAAKLSTLTMQGVPAVLVAGFAISALFSGGLGSMDPGAARDFCTISLCAVVSLELYAVLTFVAHGYQLHAVSVGGKSFPVANAAREREAFVQA
eukprot:COSAG02_NODE_18354_length_944_cov_1.188166_1_plen_177_part_10